LSIALSYNASGLMGVAFASVRISKSQQLMIETFRRRAVPVLICFLIPAVRATAQSASAPPQTEPPLTAPTSRSEILFKDDFERPGSSIDATKWLVSKTVDADVIEVRHND